MDDDEKQLELNLEDLCGSWVLDTDLLIEECLSSNGSGIARDPRDLKDYCAIIPYKTNGNGGCEYKGVAVCVDKKNDSYLHYCNYNKLSNIIKRSKKYLK